MQSKELGVRVVSPCSILKAQCYLEVWYSKMKNKTKFNDDFELHPHIKSRMLQRGVMKEKIEKTLAEGWEVDDAKPGTFGKVFVFPYNDKWEGNFFEEKEVRVYYKYIKEKFVLLTVKARYGKKFFKRREVK